MTSIQTWDGVLSTELEVIAAAADERLRAAAGQDLAGAEEAQRRVAEAATAAIAAGAALTAIAEAERAGELRARRALGTDVLRQLARTARRKRDAEREYEDAIRRAGRLGLSHREIAGAGAVSHGTVRAILTRATPAADGNPQAEPDAGADDVDDAVT